MFGFRTFNLLRPVALACFLFSVRAFAQFEIAPDHFDSDRTETVHSPDAKNKVKAAVPKDGEAVIEPASMHTRQLNQRIAEEQAILAEYRARINAKAEQIEAALQSLSRTGNEAGEAEALATYQRELDKLQKSLMPVIHATERTLARLQAEVDTKSQRTPSGETPCVATPNAEVSVLRRSSARKSTAVLRETSGSRVSPIGP